MRKLHSVGTLGMLVFALTVAWGQDSATQTPAGGAPDNAPGNAQDNAPGAAQGAAQDNGPQQPVPAYGQENPPPAIIDNPPLSGLDTPSLEPHAAPLSYIQPGATFSESIDSNLANGVGTQAFHSVSRGVGSVTLERLWSHYDLAVDYFGGAAYYNVHGLGWKLMQQMDLDQKITWKRGQLSLRDSFSYLPEGSFGGAYGSTGSQGIASLGSTSFSNFWGGGSLGSLGQVPRLMNLSLADISQELSPKSAITAAGGYAVTHYYGSDQVNGASFIGSSQTSVQVGYNRVLTAHTQIALVYGYQAFDYSVLGNAFHSHVIQGMFGHRISGRMDFLAGAGPQITYIDTLLLGGTLKTTRLGVAGQARLRYKFTRTSLMLSYERFLTSGSGFFAGAQSDIVQLGVARPLTRVWTGSADIGYSRNSRLQPLSAQQLLTCGGTGQPPCPGIDGNVYNYGFAGVGLHRAFGHNWHGFASYQFNELSFDHSYCAPLTVCSRIGNRHVVSVGLDWTPRPIRID